MTPSPQAVVLWNSTEKDMNLAHGTTLRIASFPALSRWVLLLGKVMIKILSG
jgi:hypothetical protein